MTSTHRLLRAIRRVHGRVRGTGESGTTMVEVFVAMIIMSIAGSIFVSAAVTLSRTTNHAQAVTNSATNTNQAYQALDKTVRYAAAISEPGVGTGAPKNWYVELRNTTTGIEVCTQLRVDIASQQLQRRTWNASSLATLSTWVPIASGITNGAAAAGPNQPFYLKDITADDQANSQHQELTINMASTSGPANGRVASRSSFGLTALNSTAESPTSFCQQAGRP